MLGSGEQSNIRVLPLLKKQSLTLHSAAMHAVMEWSILSKDGVADDITIIERSMISRGWSDE